MVVNDAVWMYDDGRRAYSWMKSIFADEKHIRGPAQCGAKTKMTSFRLRKLDIGEGDNVTVEQKPTLNILTLTHD